MLRRYIVFTVFLLMLAAAPVWGNSTSIPDRPRIDDTVLIHSSLTTTDHAFCMKIGHAWMR